MKNKIFIISTILLLSILFLNINTVNGAAGDTFDTLDKYIEVSNSNSSINLSNASHVANLAKEYLKNCDEIISSEYYNEDIFEYVVYGYNIVNKNENSRRNFTIYFSSKPFIYKDSNIQAQANFVRYEFSARPDHTSRVYINKVSTTATCVAFSIDTTYRAFSDYSIYNTTTLKLQKEKVYYFNWNFHDVIYFDGEAHLTTYIKEYPDYYQVTAVPVDVIFPYTLSYIIDGTEYFLEENADHIITNNFRVSKNIDDIVFICKHNLNGTQKSFTTNLNFERSTTTGMPYLSVNYDKFYTKEQLIPINIKFSNYQNLEGCHVLAIKCYNLKSDYKVYWSIEDKLIADKIHLIDYIDYSSKDNSAIYIPVGSIYELQNFDRPEKLYFYITDKNNKRLYMYTLTTSNNSYTYTYYGSSGGFGNPSTHPDISGGDYDGAFGDIGDMDSIDFDNFDVNDGINSLKSMFDSVKSVFQTISYILFGFLPAWITVPLGSLLVILIVLTIIKFIRG